VRVDGTVPPIGGVTGFVPNSSVIPFGAPEVVRYTDEENTPTD
jgi:hypothetical protein